MVNVRHLKPHWVDLVLVMGRSHGAKELLHLENRQLISAFYPLQRADVRRNLIVVNSQYASIGRDAAHAFIDLCGNVFAKCV